MPIQGSPDKAIYVTGCDTGFGNILVKKLDKLGFSVLAGVYLDKSVTSLSSECSPNVHPILVDVSDEKSVENCAKKIADFLEKQKCSLVGVVNNAGILVQPGPTEWTPNSAYRRMFDVNCMGTVMTTKSLLPFIRKSQGRIVNVASIAGRIGIPTEPAYCASKYMVEGYSEVLRKDMLPWGVTVHVIEPGVFSKTGLYDHFQTGLDALWEKLDVNMKKEYGEEYYKVIRNNMGKALVDTGNTNSELVPIAMIHALTADEPKYRYKVGFDSKYLISFLEKLHESTQDKILTREEVKPASAPVDGRKLAFARYEKGWPRFIIMLAILMFLLNKLRK